MRKDETVVDARFFIPKNIVNLRFRQDYDLTDSTFFSSDPQTPVDQMVPADPGQNESLPKPDVSFNLVSQTLRIAPDGKQVVDVVIELPDVDGAEYEMRVTRVV